MTDQSKIPPNVVAFRNGVGERALMRILNADGSTTTHHVMCCSRTCEADLDGYPDIYYSYLHLSDSGWTVDAHEMWTCPKCSGKGEGT